MLQDAANQVLATPLLALGYTLGTVQCECKTSTLKITIGLELKTTHQITVPVANSK